MVVNSVMCITIQVVVIMACTPQVRMSWRRLLSRSTCHPHAKEDREHLNGSFVHKIMSKKKAKIRKESGVIGNKKTKSQIIVNGSKNSTQVLPINGSEKDRREAAAEQAWE